MALYQPETSAESPLCCRHFCSLHPLPLSQVNRISLHVTPIKVWTDTKMSVLLLTNGSVTLPTHIQLLMRSWRVYQQVWCHQWCAFTGWYLGTSIYWGMPHPHIFCAGVAVILVLAQWWITQFRLVLIECLMTFKMGWTVFGDLTGRS